MNSLTWLDSLRDPLGFANGKNPIFNAVLLIPLALLIVTNAALSYP